jgi:hypothetical protein
MAIAIKPVPMPMRIPEMTLETIKPATVPTVTEIRKAMEGKDLLVRNFWCINDQKA